MKKIALVFRNSANMEAIISMQTIISNIFQGYAQVENYYANEFTPLTRIEADVFVIIDKKLIFKLRSHVSKLKNIVMMTRNISKDKLNEILQIPASSDVLIVNDTLESSEEMCYMFYELGIGHVNYIPFDKNKTKKGIYDEIKYVITPNEPHLVPKHIKNVINTGYRRIGFDVLIQIANILDLNNGKVRYNLIEYTSTIIEPSENFQRSYFNSFLKGQMLNEYVYDSLSAIFVSTNEGRLVYSNRHAKEIFGFVDNSQTRIESYLPENMRKKISETSEISKEMVTIDNMNYIMDKVEIVAVGRVMGYFVTMQDEIAIKDIETTFNKTLKARGLLAKYCFGDIIHSSSIMNKVISLSKRAAITEYTILITGESGTGKELFAQSMHNYSPRKNMPFVGVNCAAIPETLLESELFGYEEGAFTGARKKGKLGYFEQANKGTIFLDEIGDISPKLQARLLRVLQEKQIMRIGSDKVIDVDVRIIAATNKDLIDEVSAGKFREDLYYRLNAIQIQIPPLRERKEDVAILFQKFMGKDYISVNRDEKNKMREYNWPGNVRELENCALYYKTLKRLPEQFKTMEAIEDKKKESDINEIILFLLADNSGFGHGLGRTTLLQLLKEREIKISDVSLRGILNDMEKENLISIGKGRQGTSLTEKGRSLIK